MQIDDFFHARFAQSVDFRVADRSNRSIIVNSNSDPVEQMEGVILLAIVGRLGKAPEFDHTIKGEKFNGFQYKRVQSVFSVIEHTAALVAQEKVR